MGWHEIIFILPRGGTRSDQHDHPTSRSGSGWAQTDPQFWARFVFGGRPKLFPGGAGNAGKADSGKSVSRRGHIGPPPTGRLFPVWRYYARSRGRGGGGGGENMPMGGDRATTKCQFRFWVMARGGGRWALVSGPNRRWGFCCRRGAHRRNPRRVSGLGVITGPGGTGRLGSGPSYWVGLPPANSRQQPVQVLKKSWAKGVARVLAKGHQGGPGGFFFCHCILRPQMDGNTIGGCGAGCGLNGVALPALGAQCAHATGLTIKPTSKKGGKSRPAQKGGGEIKKSDRGCGKIVGMGLNSNRDRPPRGGGGPDSAARLCFGARWRTAAQPPRGPDGDLGIHFEKPRDWGLGSTRKGGLAVMTTT